MLHAPVMLSERTRCDKCTESNAGVRMQEWEVRDWQRTCKISLVFDMHASADTHKHTLPYVPLRGPSHYR